MKTRTVEAMKNSEVLEPFLAIRTNREYDAAVERLNALVDEIGDNPKDPRYRLIETLSMLIEAYDREHHRLPEASGVEVLRFLMKEHSLTQKDLRARSAARASSPKCLLAAAVSTCGKSRRSPRALGSIRERL